METLELFTKNIKCMGCVNNINTGLLEIKGVKRVDVELETGKVNITGTNLSKTAITEVLSTLGYPAN